ncbi:MAG: transporter associated domain-containing protein [Hyphomicrobiaceae bacterium]
MAIRDLNRAMGWALPDEEAATTVAGLIMHEAQMIPEIGQAFTFYGYRFEIVRKQRNRVTVWASAPYPVKPLTPSRARRSRGWVFVQGWT